MRLTFLGTGTSTGVPVVACQCPVCISEDQRNKRMRASILVQEDGHNIIVDASPDLRQQALREGLRRVDAVLFTHAHADHVGGIDDLRGFNVAQRAFIPCYGDEHTVRAIKQRYPYIFDGQLYFGAKPELAMHASSGPFCLFGQEIVPVPVYHGWLPIQGYRLGRFAYVTDCSAMPPEALELLKGVEVLVLGALRREPHPTHFTISEALEVVEKIGPARAYFTHIAHELDHREGSELPPGVELAYDGLSVEI